MTREGEERYNQAMRARCRAISAVPSSRADDRRSTLDVGTGLQSERRRSAPVEVAKPLYSLTHHILRTRDHPGTTTHRPRPIQSDVNIPPFPNFDPLGRELGYIPQRSGLRRLVTRVPHPERLEELARDVVGEWHAGEPFDD
jgi:hypothetical protein